MGPTTVSVPCRVCWARIRLDQARISIVDRRVVYSCQACGGSFLIRQDDVAPQASAT